MGSHQVHDFRPLQDGRKHKPRSPIDKAKAYEVVWNQVSPLFEAVRDYGDASYVYVIGEQDGPIKIGSSKDPIGRVRTMQTGNPRRLRIEYVVIGDMVLEKLLHEFWEPFAIMSSRATKPGAAPGTEWFKPEVREQFLPIMADAARRQIEYLAQFDGDVTFATMEQMVRDAHGASGFVAQGRDEVRVIARAVGYALLTRPSRI